ncbi:MAG: hypothetical protein R3C26_12665 [Calditrichia bacterium]
MTAVCSHRNIEMVQQLGADATIDYTRRDVLETAQNCDIFFDVFGNKIVFPARNRCSKAGKIHYYCSKITQFCGCIFSQHLKVKNPRGWLLSNPIAPILVISRMADCRKIETRDRQNA